MLCPNCSTSNISTKVVTELFPYGDIQQAFQATFPAMTCNVCGFGWRDYRAEAAIEYALQDYLAPAKPKGKTVDEFSEAVRELLAEYIGDSAGTREAYKDALLILAAEL